MVAVAERTDRRKYKAAWTKKKESADRDIAIPDVDDPKRKAKCLADPFRFLETYFPERFYHPWTAQQREMVEAILHRAKFGGDQAIAAPRGGGKTTLAEIVGGVYCVVAGILRFPLIVAATGPDADRILSNIKAEYEFNERFAADFPEVCYPIWALEGAPQRCNMQTVNGERTRMRWSGNYVVFPTVPERYGSKCGGSVLMTRGLDASIRGIRHGSLRPDFVLIDDADTRESGRSEVQCEVREQTIEQDIAGLSGPGRKISRLLLCTCMNRKPCIAYRFTDPAQKPSWDGKRFRLLEAEPERSDLWDEYVAKRLGGMESGDDKDGKGAAAFYIANRKAMDAGAVVANPHRFVPESGEVSALQHCFNIIADRGRVAFDTEYQNDPPDLAAGADGLTVDAIRRRLDGTKRREVPLWADLVTLFVDLGRYRCHFGAVAWKRAGAVGTVIDYYEKHTASPDVVGPERAIRIALDEIAADLVENPFSRPVGDGEVVLPSVALVDSGWLTDVPYEFCRKMGGPWKPSKGMGHSIRTNRGAYTQPPKATADKKPGDRWYLSRQRGGIWLVGMDTDYWKLWMRERLKTPVWTEDEEGNRERSRGSIALFGDGEEDVKRHGEFARHLLSETYVRTFEEGKGWVEKWDHGSEDNHYLDVLYGCCVGASMAGVKLLGEVATPRVEARNPSHESFVRRPSGMRTLKVRR